MSTGFGDLNERTSNRYHGMVGTTHLAHPTAEIIASIFPRKFSTAMAGAYGMGAIQMLGGRTSLIRATSKPVLDQLWLHIRHGYITRRRNAEYETDVDVYYFDFIALARVF